MAGKRLEPGTVEAPRDGRLHLASLCPFVAAYLGRHPEPDDLAVYDPQTGA
jgi:hypothetical protein